MTLSELQALNEARAENKKLKQENEYLRLELEAEYRIAAQQTQRMRALKQENAYLRQRLAFDPKGKPFAGDEAFFGVEGGTSLDKQREAGVL